MTAPTHHLPALDAVGGDERIVAAISLDEWETTKVALRLSDLKVGDRIKAKGWATRCLHPSEKKTVQAADDGSLFVECGHGRHYLDGHQDSAGVLEGIRRAG